VERAPTLYRYRHARGGAPDQPTVEGILARVLLEPYGSGVKAHEHTMPGPRAERLGLLQATHTQFSPILAIYFDPERRVRLTPIGDAVVRWARDEDGLRHELEPIEADTELLAELSSQTLFIADGHHRYETGLAYRQAVREGAGRRDAAAGTLRSDWIMAVLVNAAAAPMEILPTHRLLRQVEPERLANLVRDPGPMWDAVPVAPNTLSTRLAELDDSQAPVFGLIRPGDDGWLLVGDPDAVADRMRREPLSDASRLLDLAVLHTAILEDRLGIDPEMVASGQALAYTRSEADARAAVTRGEAQAAILVRPTRLSQLAAVANAGEVMPQKSTYFYPKLLTGMLFNPLEET